MLGLLLCGAGLLVGSALGQGCGGYFEPDYYSVEGLIHTRFAQTIITMQMFNEDCRETLEKEVPIIIPGNAYITSFRMENEVGETFEGKVTPSEEWQDLLDRQRQLGNAAAAIASTKMSDPMREPSRDTNEFSINVLIKPASNITVFVTYQEILYRREGFSKYFVHVPREDDFPDFEMGMVVSDKRKFLEVLAPEPAPELNSKPMYELQDLGDSNSLDGTGSLYLEDGGPVDPSERRDNEPNDYRLLTWTNGDRLEEKDVVVIYSLDYEDDGSGIDNEVIQTADGFFAHFITPTREEFGDRDIVFVLDKSGSMRGPKFQQLQKAMLEIIKDLEEKNRDGQRRDRFNIMLFSTGTEWLLGDGLQDASDPRVIANAKRAIEASEAKGWTNIGEALESAIGLLRDEKIGSGSSNRLTQTIYFLTDGLPVLPQGNPVRAQVIDRDTIRDQIFGANEGSDGEPEIQVHTMAFGNDADEVALKEIAQDNLGLYRKIYSDSDADLQLRGFFEEASAIATRDTLVEYLSPNVDPESLVVNDAAQGAQFDAGNRRFSNIAMNDGSQMVVVGQARPASRRGKRQTSARGAYNACVRRCPRKPFTTYFKCRRTCWSAYQKARKGSRTKPTRPRRPKPQSDFSFKTSAKTSRRGGNGVQTVAARGKSNPKDLECKKLTVKDLQERNRKGGLTKKLRSGHNRVEILQKRGFVCDERRWDRSARRVYSQLRRSKRQATETGKAIDMDKIVAPSATVKGYIQRFWAHQTVNRLIEEAITTEYDDAEKARRMNRRATDLSLKYKFVNELTSLVVAETPLYALREVDSETSPFLTEASLTELPPKAGCTLHVAIVVDLSSEDARRSFSKGAKYIEAAAEAVEALAQSTTVSLLVIDAGGTLRTKVAGVSKAQAVSAVALLRSDYDNSVISRLSPSVKTEPNRLIFVHHAAVAAHRIQQVQQSLQLDVRRSVGLQRLLSRRGQPANIGGRFSQVFSNANIKGLPKALNDAC